MLGASIGVPYFAARSKTNDGATVTQAPATSNAAPAPPLLAATPAPPAATPTGSPAPLPSVAAAASAIPRSPTVDQALQFNITKEWGYRNWDRKSTGPTDVGLFAVRVPLVSGTQSSSLAGSLTYYFNAQNQVEHISFRGRTGDPARLIRFLTQTYQMQPAPSPTGEQVYQVADRGGVHSELRTRAEPIVSTTSPHGSYSVELELARPGSRRYLPPRGPFLNIPRTADATTTPAASAESSASSAAANGAISTGSAYLDKVRYATPQEEDQVHWKRWPN